MEDGEFPASNDTRASGSKRSFDDLEDDENDSSGSKKGRTTGEEADPGVTAALISSLQESLQKCEDELASCQNELETAITEVTKWKSAFEKESFVPARTSPEPGFVVDYIEKLRSSETALKEQLEIAQMKLAICDLKSQLKSASVQRFTIDRDTEVESNQESTAAAGPSQKVAHLKEVEVDKNHNLGSDTHPDHGGTSSPPPPLLDELQAAKQVITMVVELKEFQASRLMEMEKMQSERAELVKYYGRIEKFLLEKHPGLVPPSASEDADE